MQFKGAFQAATLLTAFVAGCAAGGGCTDGQYRCATNNDGSSIVEVCSQDAWLLASTCAAGQVCKQDSTGGCTCSTA